MKITFGVFALAILSVPALGQVVVGPGPVVTSSPTISTLTTGVVLDVTPSVSADGRYVTLKVNPSFSSLDGFQTFTFGSASGTGGSRAVGVATLPFRPAQVGKVVFVENDKKLLSVDVPAMTLKAVSLKDAMKKISDVTKSNLVFGIRGFEQAGVNVTDPRDFTIDKGTEKDALLAMLKVAAPDTDVVIKAEDSVVHVVTQAQGDNDVITRTYYVEDIMANLPRFVSNQTDLDTLKSKDEAPKSDGKTALMPGESVLPPAVGGPGKNRQPADRNFEKSAPEKSHLSTTLADIITSSVRPEIWKANGGKIGEIAVVGNRVTITAPASVHALLDGPKHYNPNAAPMYINTGGL